MKKQITDIKLSEAIVRGTKIAKGKGITQGEGNVLEFNRAGKLECACTAGMALIGTYGVEQLEKEHAKDRYISWGIKFKSLFEPAKTTFKKKEQCLLKTVKTPVQKENVETGSIYSFIYSLNDGAGLAARYIAKKLEKCGF
jgi:hypothetical protein